MVDNQKWAPQDVQATFCATLVDEWIALGMTHAVVAPGSRSTPLAIALAERGDMAVHVIHDERVAAFTALGLGLSGTPALVLCTSGTAAANFFPSVVEARLSGVPMIVATADRPEELRGVGAPQTIDQIDLFGRHVRWFCDADVADPAGVPTWRTLASDAWNRAADGPVHLNLPFREPLLGRAGELPGRAVTDASPPSVDEHESEQGDLDDTMLADGQRGVILVGGRSGVASLDVVRLHVATGWPVVADPISGMRRLELADGGIVPTITAIDSLLRVPAFADDHLPDIVIRIGRPSTSKTLSQWVDRAVRERGAPLLQVGGPGRIDPGRNVTASRDITELIGQEWSVAETGWAEQWVVAERCADEAIRATLDGFADAGEFTEPGVARTVADELPDDVELVVASSMPIRDHEWFGGARARAHANRGANGIDGVMSTALGVALGVGSAAVLIGDLAFVHDTNALVGLAVRNADLRIVVVDNDGGGIFSFLPQASVLEPRRFEQLFGTPLGADVLGLAAAHGIATVEISSPRDLAAQLATRGPWVARVRSDRRRNVEVHANLHAAVAAAID